MRKIGIIALAVILALSVAGCGRRDNKNPEPTPSTTPATTAPTTAPATTAPTVMPEIPEIETNIPDPTVNDNSTGNNGMAGDSNGMSGNTDATDSTDMTQGNSRSRNRYHGK